MCINSIADNLKINNPKQNPRNTIKDKIISNNPAGFYPGILDSDPITM